MAFSPSEEKNIIEMLDSAVPQPLAQFDAFPKIPSTYKSRSESRGFMTVFVALIIFLMVLNDLGEYIWGWPDQEFSVDTDVNNSLSINVDMVVNMPCRYLSVDLRDAVGDRLFLSSGGLRRDGTKFDVAQATKLKEHSDALSVQQVVSQSRSSRGFFDALFRRSPDKFKPTYKYQPHSSACRIYGTLQAKKVTANLHITTLGHGYASREHVDHKYMNLSHVITEFSFGPHFPDIVQPLDDSFEVTQDPFVAYQYFLHVVPTTYIAPRSSPLATNQYSVTHYTRVMSHGQGTPGIFFKFDLDPLSITIHQRTPTFIQLCIRCVGVIGGVFVCMGYAIRIASHAVEAVVGDSSPILDQGEATGVKLGLRGKWSSNELRARSGKMVRQGSGWVMEGTQSGYSSYANSPMPNTGVFPTSPFVGSPGLFPPSNPGTPSIPPPSRGGAAVRSPSGGYPSSTPLSVPPTPGVGYATYPTTPNVQTSFPIGPPPSSKRQMSGGSVTKKQD